MITTLYIHNRHYIKMKKIILTTVLVAFAVIAYAQPNNADILATATVQSPITVAGVSPLEFGDVLPGVSLSIERTVAAAGKFTVTGQGSANVYLNFTLPEDLIGPAAAELPITFSATDAGTSTTDDQGTATAFDPSTPNYERTLSAGGALSVWIGGTVSPTVNQGSGAYSADITLTVTYD
jgi:hypothetical protein